MQAKLKVKAEGYECMQKYLQTKINYKKVKINGFLSLMEIKKIGLKQARVIILVSHIINIMVGQGELMIHQKNNLIKLKLSQSRMIQDLLSVFLSLTIAKTTTMPQENAMAVQPLKNLPLTMTSVYLKSLTAMFINQTANVTNA